MTLVLTSIATLSARLARQTVLVLMIALLPLTQAVMPALAAEAAIEGTLLLQLSGAGQNGQSVSLNFPGGPVQTVRIPSSRSFLLEGVPMGQPEELTGTIGFTSVGGSTTVNLVWNRYDQTIVVSGRSTPYATLTIGGAVSGSMRANGSGYFVAGSSEEDIELDAGDFMGDARYINFTVTPTHYVNRRGWVNDPSVTVGMATNLPEDPETVSPSFAEGGSANGGGNGGGGGGSSIVGGVVKAALVTAASSILNKLFSKGSLTSNLGPKIEKKWIDVWRGMSQQNTASKQKVIQTESTIADATESNQAADDAAEEQKDTAEEMAPTPQLCQISSAAVAAAGAENAAEKNQNKLVEKTAAKPDLDDVGDASRWCQYANSINNPDFKKRCEDQGFADQIIPGAVTGDPTVASQSDLDVTSDTPTDTGRQTEAFANLVTGEHQQLQGVSAAARDPSRFSAVLTARSVSATENLIKSSLIRTMAMNAKGTGTGAPALKAVMQSLGYPDDYITQKVGDNPSYATQLEVATKLAYQDPNFYIGLEGLTDPQLRAINVGVIAQNSAQWREIYHSVRAREMLLATILEAKIRAKQGQVAAQLSGGGVR